MVCLSRSVRVPLHEMRQVPPYSVQQNTDAAVFEWLNAMNASRMEDGILLVP